jgi:hypothetical protein
MFDDEAFANRTNQDAAMPARHQLRTKAVEAFPRRPGPRQLGFTESDSVQRVMSYP